jgi:hypothetical protein
LGHACGRAALKRRTARDTLRGMRGHRRKCLRTALQAASLAAAIVLALVHAALAEDSAPGHWLSEAPMPQAMDEIGGTAVGGKLYVVAGQTTGDDHSSLVAEYDPAAKTWRRRAAMPEGLSHPGRHGARRQDLCARRLAARHQGARDDAFVYDPRNDRWTALPKLSSRRGSVAAARRQDALLPFDLIDRHARSPTE